MALERGDAVFVVRPVLVLVVLAVVYSVVPIRPEFSVPTAVLLLVASLALFVLVLVRQERRIVRSRRPMAAAAEAIVLLVSLLVVGFSLVYVGLSASDAGSFNEEVDKLDALYFSVTVLTTTGFGDVVAVDEVARGVVTAHMVVNITVVALGVRLVARSARHTLEEREGSRSSDGSDPGGFEEP
ncbi:two pore domain potassium channel family protein [Cellulosimicrobium terreum]|nr:two pore domain potassium channel family protein [Cellulosimicrobium terreum]